MIYTVTVGKKPSQADSYLESIIDVKSVLESFMNLSIKKNLNSPLSDFRSLNLLSESTLENSNYSRDKNYNMNNVINDKNSDESN